MHGGVGQRSNNSHGWSAQLSWSRQCVLWSLGHRVIGVILRSFCLWLNCPDLNFVVLTWVKNRPITYLLVVLDVLCISLRKPFPRNLSALSDLNNNQCNTHWEWPILLSYFPFNSLLHVIHMLASTLGSERPPERGDARVGGGENWNNIL